MSTGLIRRRQLYRKAGHGEACVLLIQARFLFCASTCVVQTHLWRRLFAEVSCDKPLLREPGASNGTEIRARTSIFASTSGQGRRFLDTVSGKVRREVHPL
jgi:hypothetical protein